VKDAPENLDQARWFDQALQPYEAGIRHWLASRFGALCDVDDVIQESYLRIYSARQKGALNSPKAFFFAVARNVAVDQMRKNKLATTEPLGDWDDLEFLDQADGVEEAAARNSELELLTDAIQALPDRCRRVFTLAKVYGMSYQQIGDEMGISVHTVSAQISVGISKVSAYFKRHGDLCRNDK
jgi:RNA polymerase sigma factor (sigma-70 family)